MSVPEFLRRVPLFSHLSEPELERLGEVTRERTYPKNSVILFEDDPGDALYVVGAGQVKVVLIGEDGREVILSVLGEGDFFGEMALIDNEPRSAHVIAMQDSSLLVLRREDFEQRLREAPTIARRVTHHTIAQMIGSSRETVSRTLKDLADQGLIAVTKENIVVRDRGIRHRGGDGNRTTRSDDLWTLRPGGEHDSGPGGDRGWSG